MRAFGLTGILDTTLNLTVTRNFGASSPRINKAAHPLLRQTFLEAGSGYGGDGMSFRLHARPGHDMLAPLLLTLATSSFGSNINASPASVFAHKPT